MSAEFTKGEVSSLTAYRDDVRLYQVNIPVQHGNSGGPLLDMDGNVKGIIIAFLDAEIAFKIPRGIPQKTNYAIKSTYALVLLDSLQEVSERLLMPNTNTVPFDRAVDRAKESTVMVITY